MATLRCARCATSLPWGSKFCLRCGAATGVEAPATPPAAADPVDPTLQAELGGEIALKRLVTRGQLITTWAGVETRLGRPVHVHLVTAERDRAQRILRAARSAARLRHPRVSPVYRVAAGDRLCWYVTPVHDAATLESLLAKEPKQPLERVVEIVGHVAGALGCAHEQGAIHGALTPSAVLLDADDAVSVKDFGIEPDDQEAAPYSAPELATASFAGGSAAADQYALAAIAYEMLAGEKPQPGIAPPSLAPSRPELPPAVSTVVERAMSQRPADRFPSIVKFAQAFRNAAQGRTSNGASKANTPKRQSSVLLPPANTEPLPADFVAPPAAVPVRKARRPVILTALGMGTVLAVLALIFWQTRNGDLTAAEQQQLLARGRLLERASAEPAPAPAGSTLTESPAVSASAAAPAPAPAPAPALPPASSRDHAKPAARPAHREPPRRSQPQDDQTAPTAYITVGTNPQAAIFVNEQLVPSNPVRNWPVRPGRVFLRFQVLDTASGVWSQDMSVNIRPGDTLNLRRIRLVHP